MIGPDARRSVVPMFHVPDVRRTVAWYRDVGFELRESYGDAGEGLSFAIVTFGTSEVMFNAGGRPGTGHRRDADLYVTTADVDALFLDIRNRVEIITPPHTTFYGMREVIVRDLNGFWITFGAEVPAAELTPWPPVDPSLLRRYEGRYRSDAGSHVLVTIREGRLLAFPEDAPGVFLRPNGDHSFTPAMEQQANVSFEGSGERMTALVFEQDGVVTRFVRVG